VAKCHTAPKPAESRLPLSIAATLDLEIEQLDVRNAFLEGTLDEDVCITVPQSTDHDKTKVLKLVKALNGTKQAPRVLNDTLNNYLVTIEFKRCVSDPCIYVLESESGEPPYYLLGVYVDDMIINGSDKLRIERIKADIKARFSVDDKVPVDFIIGMKVVRDRRKVNIAYAKEVHVQYWCTDE
jgi:hypothetical protein